MKILEVVIKNKLLKLRELGFVIVHREPTESMIKCAIRDEICYGSIETYYHRMIDESIRLQNKEI